MEGLFRLVTLAYALRTHECYYLSLFPARIPVGKRLRPFFFKMASASRSSGWAEAPSNWDDFVAAVKLNPLPGYDQIRGSKRTGLLVESGWGILESSSI
jgi:hypothetical protein